MSLIGKKLNDRFYITESLAQGGFGHTYIAEDHHLRTKPKCVLKHLNPDKENLPNLRKIKELFAKEAAILKQLGTYSNQIPSYISYFEENRELLLNNGFGTVEEFFRWYNFCGIIAIKN